MRVAYEFCILPEGNFLHFRGYLQLSRKAVKTREDALVSIKQLQTLGKEDLEFRA